VAGRLSFDTRTPLISRRKAGVGLEGGVVALVLSEEASPVRRVVNTRESAGEDGALSPFNVDAGGGVSFDLPSESMLFEALMRPI